MRAGTHAGRLAPNARQRPSRGSRIDLARATRFGAPGAMATAVSADERTPMLRARAGVGSDKHDDYWTTGRYLATAVVIPMLLIASVFGAFAVEHPTRGFRQGAGRGRTVEYTLHTSCISAETRAAMPAFFRPGATVTGASIVRHDPDRPGLGLEEGVTMRPAPSPTTHSEPGRFVAAAEVDGDWGFALHNSFGETFYEIGSGEDAPMWGKACPDARTFRQRLGKVVRRLAPRLKKPLGLEEQEAERHASFVFGSCDARCDEAEWAGDAPEKKPPSARKREVSENEAGKKTPEGDEGERQDLASSKKTAASHEAGPAKASGSAVEKSKTSKTSAAPKEPAVEPAVVSKPAASSAGKKDDAKPPAVARETRDATAEKGEGREERR